MKYFLGIDQGGTHTRAAVCREDGTILSLAAAGGACHASAGMERAMRQTRMAAEEAMKAAGVTRRQIALLYGGHTGADWPEEYDLLHREVGALDLADRVIVVNDAIIALRAGTQRPYGAVLIAGTGANCAVRAPDGREFLYGYYVENELQGGEALGRRTLAAVYRSQTHRLPPTTLSARMLEYFGQASVDALLQADVQNRLGREIKHICPILFEEAERGDGVARQILIDVATEWAAIVTAGLRRFGMEQLPCDVVLCGGILSAKGEVLTGTLRKAIAEAAPQACVVQSRHEAIVGACALALEAEGISISGEVADRLYASAAQHRLVRGCA